MKKIVTWTLVVCALFTSWTFAAEVELVNVKPVLYTNEAVKIMEPTLYTNNDIQNTWNELINELVKKHQLVLKNNVLKTDYEYNSAHYYTSKMLSKDIIVPKEIKNKAKKIYFLVEEWANRVFFNDEMELKWASRIEDVKDEYNYKIVDFNKDNEEYIFDNKKLVKDFWMDKYKNVQITLIAEFSDTQRVNLSNTIYVSINDKKSVLSQLQNADEDIKNYFWYFNWNDIEEYLENLSTSMTRGEYKKMLEKAEKKIQITDEKNEKNMVKILDSIKRESDFKKHLKAYWIYRDTQNLFWSLGRGVENQLQNIRAFDVIDSILK